MLHDETLEVAWAKWKTNLKSEVTEYLQTCREVKIYSNARFTVLYLCSDDNLPLTDAKRLMKHFKSHTDPREDDMENEQITCSLCPSVFISTCVCLFVCVFVCRCAGSHAGACLGVWFLRAYLCMNCEFVCVWCVSYLCVFVCGCSHG